MNGCATIADMWLRTTIRWRDIVKEDFTTEDAESTERKKMERGKR
jgi:hypothetical protein